MRSATIETGTGKLQQRVTIGPHVLAADEPVADGGTDAGPAPHEWLLAGLGACTSMTVKMYADRKQWPLERVEVVVEGRREVDAFVFHRHVTLHGPLTEEQRARLLEIANKCPVHKTLTGPIRIETELAR
ncbi:MAG TPA: OsmC family protein [Polyangiaceae bacterium]|jgi:putative redox protein